MNINNRLYDVEDDVIDRGDATNLSEGLEYYNIDSVWQTQKKQYDEQEDLNQKIECDYHNTYYNKGSYGTRTLRMNNKQWHKLNQL